MHYSWPHVPSAVYNEKSWKSSQSRAAVFSRRPSFAYRSVPRDRHPNKNICTRGDFHPSLRACLRSAVLISGNTPRRKVCFTTSPPPRGAAEMRRGPPRARHLIWSDWEEWPSVPNCFPPPRDEKRRKWREGEKKTEKGSVFGIYWRRSMASRPSVENILMLHRCLYGNSIQ